MHLAGCPKRHNFFASCYCEAIRRWFIRMAEAQRLAKCWEETAARHCRNESFYRDLIVKIGEPFGVAARTSDDGSIQQDVLALKVPELVEQLRHERDSALAELETLQKAAGFCDEHKPDGGARNCLVCGCEKLSHALDQISYAIGEPNEMGVSYYSTTYNEQQVVEAVKTLRAQNRELEKDKQRLDWLESKAGVVMFQGNEIHHDELRQAIDKALSQPEAGKV